MPDVDRLWTPTGRHPDAPRLGEWRRALDWWEEQEPLDGVTSSVTGLGAVSFAERRLSQRHGGRPVLLLPSATYALLVALRVLGVGRGDEILVASVDWPSSTAVIELLGATPVFVPVSQATTTMVPAAARKARTAATKAVVVCHLDGQIADVPGLRHHLPGLPVVEDCAAAFGESLDGAPAGTLGDYGLLSFGPGKTLDAGEGGALVLPHDEAWRAATALSAHPVRQALAGVAADAGQPAMRPHPFTAILVAYLLSQCPPTRR